MSQEKREDPLMVYCQMWRELEAFLHETARHEEHEYAEKAEDFLKLMNSVKRKYTDV